MKRKGQVSNEYMAIVAAVLAMSLVGGAVLYLSLSQTIEDAGTRNTNYQLKNLVNEINKVYVEGEGSSSTVKFFLPRNTYQLRVGFFDTSLSIEKGRYLVFVTKKERRLSETVYTTIPIVMTDRVNNDCNIEKTIKEGGEGVVEIKIVYVNKTMCPSSVDIQTRRPCVKLVPPGCA